jgi:hypothetical protein
MAAGWLLRLIALLLRLLLLLLLLLPLLLLFTGHWIPARSMRE